MLPSLLFTRTKETTTTTTTTMIPLGLKTLADTNLSAPHSPVNCVTRNNILAVRSSPAPSPAEERIGSVPEESEGTEEEAGEDGEEEHEEEDTCWAAYGRRGKVGGRGLPPPIPHKRVLQRTYAGDGRLVIREVISERHVYFRARRRGGRLTLQLVEYFSAACTSKRAEEEEEEEEEDDDDDDAEEENSMGEISSEPSDLFMGEDPAVVASPALCGEGCYGVSERSNRFMQMPLSSIPTVHG